MSYKKNTIHQYIYFTMVKASDGTAITGGSPAGQRSIDGGAHAAVTGTISEIASAGGLYVLDTSAADTNGTNIGFLFTASTAIPVCVNIALDSTVDQTGDSYAVVTNGTYGNSALHTEVAKDSTVSKPGTAQTITAPYTVAQIATAIWQDATAGDFTTAHSIGKALYIDDHVPGSASGHAIVGSAMTLAASQHVIVDSGTVTTVTTVTNQLTAAQIATGVWQDATAGDFTTASSIGKALYTGNYVPGAANGLAIVGSAMALAASQHVIVDSGTVTTVTTLTNLPAITAGWLTATGIAATALNGKGDWSTTAPPAASAIADEVLDHANGVETGVTVRKALRAIGAAVAGPVTGARTGTEVFVGMDGTTTRISNVVDSSGNRTPTYTL